MISCVSYAVIRNMKNFKYHNLKNHHYGKPLIYSYRKEFNMSQDQKRFPRYKGFFWKYRFHW